MNARILSLLLACSAVTFAAHAEDRAFAPAEASYEDLLHKLARQTQFITNLQAQLKACQDGNAPQSGEAADEGATATHLPVPLAPAVAPAMPPRRAVGVYQQPAEPKLTCADYSTHYFSRHPAMAAVCGMSGRTEHATPQDVIPPAPVPETTSTTRLPQRP